MICDGRGCSVIAHLNCYFSAGSQDANDTISDIEHWHCENCGGLPRHMHPRPRAVKRARVSFDSDLDVVPESLITKGGSATGPQGGGWGGHWPTRTAMPQLPTGKGKEAIEDPATLHPIQDVYQPASNRHAGPRHTGNSYHNLGGGSGITGGEHIDHDMQATNSLSTRSHFGKPRPPRPKKKPPVRDKTSHHHRSDAAGQGTRPSAQSKHSF